jgi:thiol-disulfide isomerase/thioredoxin
MFARNSVLAALAVSILQFAAIQPQIAQADDVLNIGDAAPPLAVSSWVKGEKIDKFEPNKTYVVEFWATWCGPCKASIPHLTELAHEYKDKVQFIGVDVWENDTAKVQPFVDEMGEKMDYNVALDTITAGTDPMDGKMSKTWLLAADEHGIPTAFVVHDGKIAWIGHPMSLAEPLEKILAGKWDLAAMAKQRLAEKEKQRKLETVLPVVLQPYRAKNYKVALAMIDTALKDSPELTDELNGYKLAALCNSGQTDAGVKLGQEMLKTYHDDADALNRKFWDLIDPSQVDEVDPRVAQLALKAAERAVELTKQQDASVLDSLAEARFLTGDAAGAVASEEKVIAILKKANPDAPDSAFKEFTDHLARYQKAAAKDAGQTKDLLKN